MNVKQTLLPDEYVIIKLLLDCGQPMSTLELENAVLKKDIEASRAEDLIRGLLKSHLLEKTNSADQFYKAKFVVSRNGKLLCHAAQKDIEEHTANERQQRFDNKISVLSLLIPLVTFLLGILIEHYTGVLSALLSVFH